MSVHYLGDAVRKSDDGLTVRADQQENGFDLDFLCAVDEAVLQGLLIQIEREIDNLTQH